MINADKLGKRGDADFAAEEARLLDELLAAADLSSPTTVGIRPVDLTRDPESPYGQLTWPAPIVAPHQPVEPMAAVSPAYGPPAPVPTFTDATMIDADGIGARDKLHQTWSFGGAETSVEAPAPVNDPPGASELSSITEEVRSFDLEHEPGTPPGLASSQATVALVPAQPEELPLSVAPALDSPMTILPSFADTTTIDAHALGELDQVREVWTDADTEFGVALAEPADELPAPIDLRSPISPEVRSLEDTSDDETLEIQVADLAPASDQQRPATVSSSASSTPAPLGAASADEAPSKLDKPSNLDARYRPWTLRDREAVVEESEPLEEAAPFDTSGSLDARYRPWTLRDREPVVEATKPLEEPAALDHFGWPTTSEDRPDDLTDDGATNGHPTPLEVTDVQQPGEREDSVMSSEDGQPSSLPVSSDITTRASDVLSTTDSTYRPWTLRRSLDANKAKVVDEPALDGEETAPVDEPVGSSEEQVAVDEPVVSADLDSPGTAERRSGDQASHAEPSHDQATWLAGPAPALAQRDKQADWVARSAKNGSAPLPRFSDNKVSKPDRLDTRYLAWTLPSSQVATEHVAALDTPVASADEHEVVDENEPSADLDSPAMPEGRAADRPSDDGAPEAPVTTPEASAPGQPADLVGPSASDEPAIVPASPVIATAISAERPDKIDARYRTWSPHNTRLAAEKTEPVEEPAAADKQTVTETPAVAADADSPGVPEIRSGDRPSDAVAPQSQLTPPAQTALQQSEDQATTVPSAPYRIPIPASPALSETTMMLGDTRRWRGGARVLVTTLAVVFFVATLGSGFVALKQDHQASQWRQDYQSQVALSHSLATRSDSLSTQLALAHATATSLQSKSSALNGQIKSLQVQLSSVSSSRAKLLNRSALLTQLTNEAGTVSSELSMCVGETNSLQTEIGKDLVNPSHKDPLLQSNLRTASQVCASAQQGNRQLQSTLRGG